MIKKILIANRGEIALRIIRACNDLNIKTVIIYSQADELSLPVQLADEAICIGKAESLSTYLRADLVLSAAEISNADAIHPGFGFLSENSLFAEQCQSCNIKFIGPSSEAIKIMGDKSSAREIAKNNNIPTIPGSNGIIKNELEALEVSEKIGFPLIIKAVAGGGGKGMRLVNKQSEFIKELNLARNESQKSFGENNVYIEKFIQNPRHIEVQILADSYNNIIHCGERDCSVQRRYQKLIEEAPSSITEKTREKMCEAAIKLAKACNYVNAGTVEFLVDENENFYFMEMNTRIQVEHGITEIITGIDLVKEQILIAQGNILSVTQKNVNLSGHAIECRINAENPDTNFSPCPGVISLCCTPGGPGIRVDSHIYSGYKVPPYYDSMISKIIAFGPNRITAINRMQRALSEYIIKGIPTTIKLSQKIMLDSNFINNNITTNFLPNFLNSNQ